MGKLVRFVLVNTHVHAGMPKQHYTYSGRPPQTRYVGLILVQRRRRWAKMKPTLCQRLLFAGSLVHAALARSHTFPANSNFKPALVQSLVLGFTWFPSGLIQLVRVQSGKAQDVDPVPLQC